jgi:hypothetical protein
MTEMECGCGPSCSSTADSSAPVACTLNMDDFRERTASIRNLARRFLQKAVRNPKQTLTLTYAGDALAELRELVAKEKACCAFLAFDLRQRDQNIVLTITAPEAAAESADLLFGHFAPDTNLEMETTE